MLVKQIGEVEVSYHASDDPVVSFLVNQIAQNYQNSNGDCKCYFDSIQDKESVA
tara:strand:+ start:1406 stop:1567 length:162 start_codon:yes stop_codon:yes gene_type:complete